MKKIFFVSLTILGILAETTGFSAPVSRRATRNTASSTNGAAPQTTAARSAVSARSARGTAPVATTANKTSGTRTMGARSATPTKTTPTVAARAATTQKVIGTGSKVTTAAKNVLINEECQAKYDGCMDAFCMIDNANGGRCICNNRIKDLDTVLAEIEKLDEQSYQMATLGVEKLEMGLDADEAIKAANEVAESLKNPTKSARQSLNLDMWSMSEVEEDGEFADIFADSSANMSPIDGKEGDALFKAANDLCKAQIPECNKDLQMLELAYSQKIKSDCSAYENSLKQKRNQSAQKLNAAERALRESALEQYQNANKYDLGQCMIKFKECMQTTAECGADFSSCASVVASDMTNVRKSSSKQNKTFKIKGAVSTIEISASTYDTLIAKKPICDTVTKQCTKVAGQVWDAFLKEIAPDLHAAEIIAEDNARQNCIGNISSCFQKACKDNIDPKNPEGSYDMCLSRPETMLNLCKVPLEACGINTTSTAKAQDSLIWDYVVAALAAQRVDACTNEVKSCLQDENRCGKDYNQCVGLDTDTIVRMCPYDKLTACQQVYDKQNIREEDAVYDELARIAQGILLNIDNSLLTQCQNALDKAMVKVCGDTDSCDGIAVDSGTGERSFKYQVCQYTSDDSNNITWNGVCRDSLDGVSKEELTDGNWAGKLSGTMYWGDISYSCNTNDDNKEDCSFTTEEEYINALEDAGYVIDEETKKVIKERVFGMEIRSLVNSVNMTIDTIESDPMVQYCMTGRKVQGLVRSDESIQEIGRGTARFPYLTQQMRKTIALHALKNAREAYNVKYDTELTRMMKDQVKAAQRLDETKAIQAAESACKAWAENSALPQSKAPKTSNAGKWIAFGLLIAAAVVAAVFTAGAGGVALGTAAMAVVGSVGIGSLGAGIGVVADISSKPVGEANIEQWNYKENITTTFQPSTGVCTKVRVYQNCENTKKNYCEKWMEPVEVRDKVNLL